jgi:hypothetical protein
VSKRGKVDAEAAPARGRSQSGRDPVPMQSVVTDESPGRGTFALSEERIFSSLACDTNTTPRWQIITSWSVRATWLSNSNPG